MKSITEFSKTALRESLLSLGLKSYAADQVFQWIHQKRAVSFDAMSNLSGEARQKLAASFRLGTIEVADVKHSVDGTCLFLFRLNDGKQIEAVYIPSEKRKTLCLSTQVGCAMACDFCRTGKMGLMRNLTQGEILEQVASIQNCFPEEKITNLVFMGMGEPMANLQNLMPAIEILLDDNGFGFSRRRITVSTVGLVPKMFDYLRYDFAPKLAISLHAPNDALRSRIVPINDRYPLAELMRFCRDYKKSHKFRITFEYVMLREVNDRPEHIEELIRLLEGIPTKINLIPFNSFPGVDYQSSTPETMQTWVDRLMQAGIQTNIRASRGRDILAACGQLAA